MSDQQDEIIEKLTLRLNNWTSWGRGLLTKASLIPQDRQPSDAEVRDGVEKLLATPKKKR